uniref:Transmembrane protein n=1 Tax=Echinostoma caproni TaxID=27848 RepID=A0A182ZZ83_9TREM
LLQWNQQMLVDRIVPSIVGDIDNENLREAADEVVSELLRFFGNYGLFVFLCGLFLFFLAFCGVFGVCCKNKVLLGIFKNEVQEVVRKFIVHSYVMDNDNPPNAGLTVFINRMQQKVSGGFHSLPHVVPFGQRRNGPQRRTSPWTIM